jgi:trehalose 6-phosphate phosphatase
MPMKKTPRLILLDYDGTILPLKRHIDHSFLSTPTRGILSGLAQRHRVIFVTGRDLRDLRRLAGPLKGIGIIGTHGVEVSGIPRLQLAEKSRLNLFIRDRKNLASELKKEFTIDPGVFLQVKRYALSLHFFHPGQDEEDLRERFRRVIRFFGTKGLWEFQIGKHMIDLRPKGFSKAKAVQALLKLYPNREILFAGDDLSDLPVFKLLKGRGLRIGIGHVIDEKDCDLWFPTPINFVKWLEKI